MCPTSVVDSPKRIRLMSTPRCSAVCRWSARSSSSSAQIETWSSRVDAWMTSGRPGQNGGPSLQVVHQVADGGLGDRGQRSRQSIEVVLELPTYPAQQRVGGKCDVDRGLRLGSHLERRLRGRRACRGSRTPCSGGRLIASPLVPREGCACGDQRQVGLGLVGRHADLGELGGDSVQIRHDVRVTTTTEGSSSFSRRGLQAPGTREPPETEASHAWERGSFAPDRIRRTLVVS